MQLRQQPLRRAGMEIKNPVTNCDADAALSPTAKDTVRQILDREIGGRVIRRIDPASQSHPSSSNSCVGSSAEQDPQLASNVLIVVIRFETLRLLQVRTASSTPASTRNIHVAGFWFSLRTL